MSYLCDFSRIVSSLRAAHAHWRVPVPAGGAADGLPAAAPRGTLAATATVARLAAAPSPPDTPPPPLPFHRRHRHHLRHHPCRPSRPPCRRRGRYGLCVLGNWPVYHEAEARARRRVQQLLLHPTGTIANTGTGDSTSDEDWCSPKSHRAEFDAPLLPQQIWYHAKVEGATSGARVHRPPVRGSVQAATPGNSCIYRMPGRAVIVSPPPSASRRRRLRRRQMSCRRPSHPSHPAKLRLRRRRRSAARGQQVPRVARGVPTPTARSTPSAPIPRSTIVLRPYPRTWRDQGDATRPPGAGGGVARGRGRDGRRPVRRSSAEWSST